MGTYNVSWVDKLARNTAHEWVKGQDVHLHHKTSLRVRHLLQIGGEGKTFQHQSHQLGAAWINSHWRKGKKNNKKTSVRGCGEIGNQMRELQISHLTMAGWAWEHKSNSCSLTVVRVLSQNVNFNWNPELRICLVSSYHSALWLWISFDKERKWSGQIKAAELSLIFRKKCRKLADHVTSSWTHEASWKNRREHV